MQEGRGLFCQELPQGTIGWNTAKWKEHLEFLPFNPENEVELGSWFEDAAFNIIANAATADITLKVIQLVSKSQMRGILNSCFAFVKQMKYIEDLADSIAVRLFKGNKEMQAVEESLFHQVHQHSVLKAFMTYRRLEERYTYMATRRNRGNILGTHQVITVIQLLPLKLVRKIMTNLPTKVWTPSELFTYALELEDKYKSAPSEVRYAEEHIYQAGNPLLEEESMEMNTPHCTGCLGNHLRKNCPHVKSGCRQCSCVVTSIGDEFITLPYLNLASKTPSLSRLIQLFAPSSCVLGSAAFDLFIFISETSIDLLFPVGHLDRFSILFHHLKFG